MKKWSLVIFLTIITSLFAFFFLLRNYAYEIPVLMYHSVSNYPKSFNTPCVSPQRFEQQMRFIKKMGYRVLSLREYYEIITAKEPLPGRNLVVITFDDGYEDNFLYASRILKKYGFPATIFMVASRIGEKGYLNMPELKILSQENITIGSHTLTESYLPQLGERGLKYELCESKRILERIINRPVEYIAYPTGGFDRRVEKMAKECGYKLGFTTNRGYIKSHYNKDPFAIKRIKITQKDIPFILFFKLSGIYNLFREVKDPS